MISEKRMKLKLEAELKVAQMTDDFSVLVVDDNEINLNVNGRYIRCNGH